jgi:hypothetical protein
MRSLANIAWTILYNACSIMCGSEWLEKVVIRREGRLAGTRSGMKMDI